MDSRSPFTSVAAFESAFGVPERIVPPASWVGHIPFAWWLLKEHRPAIFVELGVHTGNSYCAFCQGVQKFTLETRCVAVDTWKGDPQAGWYGDEVFAELKAYHDPRYGTFSQFLRGTFAEALPHFADGTIDLLHIDGYHTYDAVKGDFESWLPKMSRRGVILLHDTEVRRDDFGVWKLWEEIKGRFPTFELLHSHGLGVVATGDAYTSAIQSLFDASLPEERRLAQQLFASLGQTLIERGEREAALIEQSRLRADCEKAERELRIRDRENHQAEQEKRRVQTDFSFAKEELKSKSTQLRIIGERLDRALRTNLAADKQLRESHQEYTQLVDELESLRQANVELRHELELVSKLKLVGLAKRISKGKRWVQQKRRAGAVGEEDRRVIEQSGLFDAEYYRSQVSGREAASSDLIRHYLKVGEPLGYSPNQFFDPEFYYETNPDVPRESTSAFLHYLHWGMREGRDPHPLFNVRHYVGIFPEAHDNPLQHYFSTGIKEGVSPCCLLDGAYYEAQLEEKVQNPLEHYLLEGWKNGAKPHPLFDPAFYVRKYPDVASQNIPPLLHFMQFGLSEGRISTPLFDPDFYLRTNPDVSLANVKPFVHFLQFGVNEERSPHPLFDSAYYLNQYPSVEKSGMGPLIHFITEGAAKNYNPCALFDTGFYRDKLPELWNASTNPLEHYLEVGAHADIDPTPLFDGKFYRSEYPSAVASGNLPLIDYITEGWLLDRLPSRIFDPWHYREKYPESIGVNPLAHFLEYGLARGARANRYGLDKDRIELTQALRASRPAGTIEQFARSIHFDPAPSPDASVIIPVHNNLLFTLRCLRSLQVVSASRGTKAVTFEVIVVDDMSNDETERVLPMIPGLRYLRNERNLGFLESCNYGASQAQGNTIVLLNNDTCVLPGWLESLISPLTDKTIGLVGAKLLFPNGRVQEAGGIIWADGSGWNYGRGAETEDYRYNYLRDADYCSGACIAIPRTVWQQLDGFDRRYAPAYYEDTDLAFRVREIGLRTVYQPLSRIIHFEGASCGTDLSSGVKKHQALNQPKFVSRWKDVLGGHGMPPGDNRKSYVDRPAAGRILFIDVLTPMPDQDSGSNDTWNYIKILKELGYAITFIPAGNFLYWPPYTQRLEALGVECVYRPYFSEFRSYLEQEGARFDAVFLYRAPLAWEHIDDIRELMPQAKIIFDTVDLHFLRLEREATLRQDQTLAERAAKQREEELSVMRRADATILLSEEEAKLIETLAPGVRTKVVPIVREIPGRTVGFAERSGLCFVGGFNHPPNVDAVQFFCREIFPLVRAKIPGIEFSIIGSNMPPALEGLSGNGVIVRGFVPDLTEILLSVRLTVAPLRFGAGQKGKVVMSLSYGVPCVMTNLAAEGMGIEPGLHGLISDAPEEFAELIVRAYEDAELWTSLSDNGLELAREKFSIATVRGLLMELLAELNIPLPRGTQQLKRHAA